MRCARYDQAALKAAGEKADREAAEAAEKTRGPPSPPQEAWADEP